jgi:uncharacterized protein
VNLALLDTSLSICRLDPTAGMPAWFELSPPLSAAVVRAGELTLVAPEEAVPGDVIAERGWRAIEFVGTMDLAMTGVTAKLSGALAEAGVALFAVSTYDTDVLLVREEQADRAIEALRAAGHQVAL